MVLAVAQEVRGGSAAKEVRVVQTVVAMVVQEQRVVAREV